MSKDAKQVVGGILTIVGYAITPFTGWGYALVIVGAALSYSGARQAAKDAQREALKRSREAAASQAIKGNVRGGAEVHNLVFGEIRVGGVICVLGVDLFDTKVLHIGVAHSLAHAGGCEGITDIWIDDSKILAANLSGDPNAGEVYVTLAKYNVTGTNMVKVRHYKGTATQAADTQLISAGIGVATDYRRGIAWTRFTLTRPAAAYEEDFRNAFPRGVPVVAATLRGIKCYDPRKDSTNGGAGTHRYNDPLTWEWTRNSALCTATYMIMARSDGGMGRDPAMIDWALLAASANICDETVQVQPDFSGTEARFSCDIGLSSGDSAEVNLRRILDTMLGECIRVDGVYKIYAGAYRAPTFTLDESWLRGDVVVRTRAPLDQLYNAVRVLHDDASQNYRQVEAPAYTNSTYETDDGGERLWREEVLEGVASTWQAQRHGRIIGLKSRAQRIIEVPCNLKAFDVECWETGTVTLGELGLAGTVHRIVDWTWDGVGPVLILQQEDSAYYLGAAYANPNTDAPPALVNETPPIPAGVAATAGVDGIDVSWTDPHPTQVKQIDIFRATSAGGTYTQIASAVGYRYHDPITVSGTYYYKLKSHSEFGVVSDFSAVVNANINGAADVVNLGLANIAGTSFSGRDAVFIWDNGQPPSHVRFRDYRVRIIDPADASVMRTVYTTAPNFRYTHEMNLQDATAVGEGYSAALRSFTIEVVQVAIDGSLSATPATLTVSNPAPTVPGSPQVTLAAGIDYIEVSFDQPSDPDLQGVRVYVDTVSGFTPGAGNLAYEGPYQKPVVVTGLEPATTYYVKVIPFDVFGVGGTTTQQSIATTGIGADDVPPTAPSNLTLSSAIVGTTLYAAAEVKLAWDAATDNSGKVFYEIEYWIQSTQVTSDTRDHQAEESGGMDFSQDGSTTQPAAYSQDGSTTQDAAVVFRTSTAQREYRVFPVEIGATIYARIRAADFSGNTSAWTSVVTYTVPSSGVAPPNVTGVVGTGRMDKIVVEWTNPPADNFKQVIVYRGTSASFTANDASEIARAVGTVYVDADVVNGTSYWYRFATVSVEDVVSAASDSVGPFAAFKITAANVSTFFESAAIGDAYIVNLDATKITAGDIAAARMQTNLLAAAQASIGKLSAITADIGEVTAGIVTGLLLRSSRGLNRVEFDASGIRAYQDVSGTATQRVNIANDGSGWLGSSSALSWTAAGVLTVQAANVAGTLTGNTIQTSSGNPKVILDSTNGIRAIDSSGAVRSQFATNGSGSLGVGSQGTILTWNSSGEVNSDVIPRVVDSADFTVGNSSQEISLKHTSPNGASYFSYLLIIKSLELSADAFLQFQVRTEIGTTDQGIKSGASDYAWVNHYLTTAGGHAVTNSAGDSKMELDSNSAIESATADACLNMNLWVRDPRGGKIATNGAYRWFEGRATYLAANGTLRSTDFAGHFKPLANNRVKNLVVKLSTGTFQGGSYILIAFPTSGSATPPPAF